MIIVVTITEESEGISLLDLMILLAIEMKMIKNQKGIHLNLFLYHHDPNFWCDSKTKHRAVRQDR